ncbi:hypothetical protein KY348_02545 [Candidatus Woesearchaeota archaeon]|nr:hypothetical protein [Candidatus Woesearchaeota archaeon]
MKLKQILKQASIGAFVPGLSAHHWTMADIIDNRASDIKCGRRQTPTGTLINKIDDSIGYGMQMLLLGMFDTTLYAYGYGIALSQATGINMIGMNETLMDGPDLRTGLIVGLVTVAGRAGMYLFSKAYRKEEEESLQEALTERYNITKA